jgi:hypothetical protein
LKKGGPAAISVCGVMLGLFELLGLLYVPMGMLLPILGLEMPMLGDLEVLAVVLVVVLLLPVVVGFVAIELVPGFRLALS